MVSAAGRAEHGTAVCLAGSAPGHTLRGSASGDSHRLLHIHVYSSISRNGRKVDATHVSIN